MENIDKQHKQAFFTKAKLETLEQDADCILKTLPRFSTNAAMSCDIVSGSVSVMECRDKDSVALWNGFVHLTTSLPFREPVGRRVKLFVLCDEHILGMVCLSSAMAQLRQRDLFLNWDFTTKWTDGEINRIFNIQTCVPIRRYAPLLTGKLLVYAVFSQMVRDLLESKYDIELLGFETTSLYGKSSMYNRIPFLKYLGLTDGNSAIYLSQSEWKRVLDEYYQVYPRTATKRQAPVKFQIVDKLRHYYESRGKQFPYEYQSESFRRGVYFGYIDSTTLEERISQWRERWLATRQEHYVPDMTNGISDVACEWLNDKGFVEQQLSLL